MLKSYQFNIERPHPFSGVIVAASCDDVHAYIREQFPKAQDVRVYPLLTIAAIKSAISMGAITFYTSDANGSPMFRVGDIVSLCFGGRTGELEGLENYLWNSDINDVCSEIREVLLSTLRFDAHGNPTGVYPACVECIENSKKLKPGDVTKTPDGQFIFKDYVVSPCRNAFNEHTSYWISKRGCTIAVYCFSDTYGDPETEVLEGMTGFISMFEDRMAQIK